jgi:hypothetical protein
VKCTVYGGKHSICTISENGQWISKTIILLRSVFKIPERPCLGFCIFMVRSSALPNAKVCMPWQELFVSYSFRCSHFWNGGVAFRTIDTICRPTTVLHVLLVHVLCLGCRLGHHIYIISNVLVDVMNRSLALDCNIIQAPFTNRTNFVFVSSSIFT